jgi:hypothetical protein
VGVTRALATSLATQLTAVVVTSAQPVDPPVLRVLVDVIAFELTGDRQVVLAARWTIIDGMGRRSLAVEQATLTEPVAAVGGDSAIVAAMALALEKLANREFRRLKGSFRAPALNLIHLTHQLSRRLLRNFFLGGGTRAISDETVGELALR